MAKPDQDTLATGVSQSAEEAPQGESSSAKPGQTADDSSGRPENQAKPALQAKAKVTVLADITALQSRIEALMAEKEQLMMSFAFAKVPRPYYIRWKEEVNLIFAQAVAVNLRRRAIARRAQEAKAKKPA